MLTLLWPVVLACGPQLAVILLLGLGVRILAWVTKSGTDFWTHHD